MLMIPCFAFGAITPQKGDMDEHVRTIKYDPKNVVNLTTYYGVSTFVQFGDDEQITDDNSGDPAAWTIRKGANYLFVQPKERNADTNYTVVTSYPKGKRVYHFALLVEDLPEKDTKAWRNPNLVFSLSFDYPEREVIRQSTTAKTAEKEKIRSKLSLKDQNKDGFNFDYWAAGSFEISPTSARDDGRFIFLTFGNNRDMPAIYEVNSKGEEAIVKTSVQGNTIIVEKMTRRLILRKGALVTCIVNQSFSLDDGMDNTSGTVAPEVERVIKEEHP